MYLLPLLHDNLVARQYCTFYGLLFDFWIEREQNLTVYSSWPVRSLHHPWLSTTKTQKRYVTKNIQSLWHIPWNSGTILQSIYELFDLSEWETSSSWLLWSGVWSQLADLVWYVNISLTSWLLYSQRSCLIVTWIALCIIFVSFHI